MKNLIAWISICFFPLLASAAQPWQEVTVPTIADTAQSFANPPREYAAIHWAIWGGLITKDRILNDIDRVNASGGGVYMINNSRALQPAYFTPEYLDLVKFAVDECKKRGMKVWIEGDAGYPDGFAGGMISKDHPELGMQGIVADARYTVAAGQTLNIPLPTDTLGIFANQIADSAANAAAPDQGKPLPIPADGKLKWTGPSGATWDVTVRSPGGEGHYSVVAGQTLGIDVPSDTQSIEAGPRVGGRGGRGQNRPASTIIPVPASGPFTWTAPATGAWEVTFVRHVYRSSPTRFSDREDGTSDKDSLYSLIDYLNPDATAMYLKLIHSRYEQIVGDEFGKTVLGFRADETDYTGFIPWTPKLLDTFKQEKGYNLQPYIAGFFAYPLTDEARRAKADYWDVWSGMFRDNFYKPLQDWCRARGMDYMVHLNHEETMLSPFGGEGMISNEGSFWRDMRYMGVPGVDNLNQIGPGIVADFPKIAASASHVNGRPLAWDEEGGELNQRGKFIADYQMVRGMNYLNVRGLNSPAPATQPAPLFDSAAATGWYITRTQHILAIGRPAAQVALYHATDSYWLGDQEADTIQLKIATELMEHQIDFDHVDADALTDICTLEGGTFKNLSGQVYRAVIIPTSTVIQKNMLDRLRTFAAAGGKVIFVGRTPTMVADQTFLHAGGPPDLSFATLEPKPEITAAVIAALPKPDVQLDSPCPPVKYIRRTLADGDAYFFFNESAETQSRTATLAGNGTVQIWDATDGTIHPLAGITAASGSVDVPLVLAPHEAKLIVIGSLPPGAGLPLPTRSESQTLLALDGNWSVTMGQKQIDTPLKNWQDLGNASFTGIAEYRKSFDLSGAPPQGRRIYLDLGNVGEIAHINLNGTDFDAHGWTPFVWDVTDSIKPSGNALVVQVQVPPAGRGFNFGRAGGGANGGAGAGRAGAAGGAGRAGAGRGRGAGGGGGGGAVQTEPPAPHGLLGPVRVISQ